MIRARILVSGSVQDVGYRAHVARIAQSIDMKGIVRNRDDGRVEIFCSAESKEKIEEFVKKISAPEFMIIVEKMEIFYEGEEGFESHPHHDNRFAVGY